MTTLPACGDLSEPDSMVIATPSFKRCMSELIDAGYIPASSDHIRWHKISDNEYFLATIEPNPVTFEYEVDYHGAKAAKGEKSPSSDTASPSFKRCMVDLIAAGYSSITADNVYWHKEANGREFAATIVADDNEYEFCVKYFDIPSKAPEAEILLPPVMVACDNSIEARLSRVEQRVMNESFACALNFSAHTRQLTACATHEDIDTVNMRVNYIVDEMAKADYDEMRDTLFWMQYRMGFLRSLVAVLCVTQLIIMVTLYLS